MPRYDAALGFFNAAPENLRFEGENGLEKGYG